MAEDQIPELPSGWSSRGSAASDHSASSSTPARGWGLNHRRTRTRRPPSKPRTKPGGWLIGLGALAFIVSFAGVPWVSASGGTLSYGDISSSLTAEKDFYGQSVHLISLVYFGGLGVGLAIGCVLSALLAGAPGRLGRTGRLAAVALAALSAVVTFIALKTYPGGTYDGYLAQATVGFYLVVAAFIAVGVGAVQWHDRAEGWTRT